MFWPCETRTSTCRSFATISSGLYRFLAIAVLLDVKDIPQVGPLPSWCAGDHMTLLAVSGVYLFAVAASRKRHRGGRNGRYQNVMHGNRPPKMIFILVL